MMELFLLVTVPLLFCAFVFLYKHQQLKNRLKHIPGYEQLLLPLPIFKYLPSLLKPHVTDLHQLFWKHSQQGYKKFGSIFKFVFCLRNLVLISDPDFAKFVAVNHDKLFEKNIPRSQVMREEIGTNIFNAIEDDIWRRHRLLLNPAFSDDSTMVVAGWTERITKRLFEEIDKTPNRRDVVVDMANLTLDVIGHAGFGYDFNTFSSQHDANSVMNAQARLFYNSSKFTLFPRFMRHWTAIPFLRQFHSDKDKFFSTIGDIIDHRLKEEQTLQEHRDILSLLIAAAKDVKDDENDELKPLTKREMLSDCYVFILAGHETTARTLAFGLFLLSLYPEVQKKAQEQVDEVLGNEESPNYSQMEKLRYIGCIMKETLRLFPAAVGTIRMAKKNFEFKNVKIPKGTMIGINWHNLQTDDKYFDNAKAFIPERWIDSTKHEPSFHFTPFGVGKRSCIGRRFAETEMMFVFSMLLKKYNVICPKGSNINDLDLELNTTLISKKPIPLMFQRRNEYK